MPGQLPNEKKMRHHRFSTVPKALCHWDRACHPTGFPPHTHTHTKGPTVDILFVVLFVLCSQVCVGESLEKSMRAQLFFVWNLPWLQLHCQRFVLSWVDLFTCSPVDLLTPVDTCWHLLTLVDLLTCWPVDLLTLPPPSLHPPSFPTVAFCILLDTS